MLKSYLTLKLTFLPGRSPQIAKIIPEMDFQDNITRKRVITQSLGLFTPFYQVTASGGSRMCRMAEKKGVSLTLFKKMHKNSIFSPITGGGRTPGTPYAGSATDRPLAPPHLFKIIFPLT